MSQISILDKTSFGMNMMRKRVALSLEEPFTRKAQAGQNLSRGRTFFQSMHREEYIVSRKKKAAPGRNAIPLFQNTKQKFCPRRKR